VLFPISPTYEAHVMTAQLQRGAQRSQDEKCAPVRFHGDCDHGKFRTGNEEESVLVGPRSRKGSSELPYGRVGVSQIGRDRNFGSRTRRRLHRCVAMFEPRVLALMGFSRRKGFPFQLMACGEPGPVTPRRTWNAKGTTNLRKADAGQAVLRGEPVNRR
jgi:hypothetical protein